MLTRQLTGVRPTIHIGELLFASGDAMKDVITFAFDLPKDNKVEQISKVLNLSNNFWN